MLHFAPVREPPDRPGDFADREPDEEDAHCGDVFDMVYQTFHFFSGISVVDFPLMYAKIWFEVK